MVVERSEERLPLLDRSEQSEPVTRSVRREQKIEENQQLAPASMQEYYQSKISLFEGDLYKKEHPGSNPEAKFTVPAVWDIVDFGVGLSYRPASLFSLASKPYAGANFIPLVKGL